ncbi:TonB-dependent receptor plug domain-containing protein [Desulfurispira natronophila]|uniref:Outer membrane receptor for ferrienterochelin and colicin n=1 Tax=Desulfurispira natronophila TaxID=682562 RepID=A0A7W8DGI6_9BACT|nr:TonB-dependent receptor [Desulfurispira natronophila]MBB5021541.1 outer membrane receptor for ferrienterochelin and colicin [Desulfurispira natronophila]
MSIRRISALCVAGLISAAALPAQAQDKSDERGVTVTATRAERELLEVPTSVSSVSAEEIRRSGAAVVAEALRDVPGVEVHDGSVSGAKRVRIRGESGAGVLIMIDGQKTSEQKAMSGAVFLIDPALIERIEIIKGPSSVLYGSEAIGGVVNIITKKGGERPVQADVGLSYDSSTEGTRQNLSIYGKSGRMGYRVGGAWSDHDDRDTPDGKAEGTEYKESSVFAYLDYQGDEFTVGARYDSYKGVYRTYVPEGTISDPIEHFAQDLPDWSREKVSLFYETEYLSDSLVKLRADAYAQNTYKDFRMDMDVRPVMGPSGPALWPMQTRNRTVNDQDTYGLALQTDWLVANDHYVIAGVDLIQDHLKADEFRRTRGPVGNFPGPPAPEPDFVESSYTNKAKSDFYALYVQDEWSLNPDTILTWAFVRPGLAMS